MIMNRFYIERKGRYLYFYDTREGRWYCRHESSRLGFWGGPMLRSADPVKWCVPVNAVTKILLSVDDNQLIPPSIIDEE